MRRSQESVTALASDITDMHDLKPLAWNNIGHRSAVALATAVRSCVGLTSLDLFSNRIDNASVIALGTRCRSTVSWSVSISLATAFVTPVCPLCVSPSWQTDRSRRSTYGADVASALDAADAVCCSDGREHVINRREEEVSRTRATNLQLDSWEPVAAPTSA